MRLSKHKRRSRNLLVTSIIDHQPINVASHLFPNHSLRAVVHFGWSQHLRPPLEDLVLSHFYETTKASSPEGCRGRYLHLLLLDLFSRSAPGSPLRLAAQTIAHATSTKSRPNITQVLRERYGQATSTLNAPLRKPGSN